MVWLHHSHSQCNCTYNTIFLPLYNRWFHSTIATANVIVHKTQPSYLCTTGGLLAGKLVVPCCCRLAVLNRASRLIGAVPGVVPVVGSSWPKNGREIGIWIHFNFKRLSRKAWLNSYSILHFYLRLGFKLTHLFVVPPNRDYRKQFRPRSDAA